MKTKQNPLIPSIDFYELTSEERGLNEIVELVKKTLTEETLSTSKGWDHNFDKVVISFIETYEALADDHRFYTNIVASVSKNFFEKLIQKIQNELPEFQVEFNDEYEGDPGQLFMRFYPSKKY